MKRKVPILIILSLALSSLIVFNVRCQQPGIFTFSGKIEGSKDTPLVFNRLRGHKETKIAELKTEKDGTFIISLNEIPPSGQYRLRIDPGKQNGILDFLVTGENMRFSTHLDFLTDSIHFENSGINEAWYQYFHVKDDFEGRLAILDHLLGIYPDDKRFYPEIIKEFNLLQDERDVEFKKIIIEFPGTLLEKYIRSDQPPRINPFLSAEERKDSFRRNFFKNLDFTDTMLLRTDIFPGKVLSYIMLYRNSQMNREQQALEFIRATDNLLPLAMVQPVVYNYLLEYTISGFEQIGLEQVLQHIADNYPVDETCVSNQDSGELQRRMEGYRKLAPGNQAPEIVARDIHDVSFQLSASEAGHTLIVFWASWCPHCNIMLPEIRKLAVQQNSTNHANPRLRVVSVSIDHEEKEYRDYLQENSLDDPTMKDFWVNICDYKAWDGKIANDYYLYATPTMILTGENRLIKGKPSNMQELVKQLGL